MVMTPHHTPESIPDLPPEVSCELSHAELGSDIKAAYDELRFYNSPEYAEFEVTGAPTVFDEHGLSISAIHDGGVLSVSIEITNPIAGQPSLIYTKAPGVDAWSFNRPEALDKILTNADIATRLRDLFGIVDRNDALLRLFSEVDDEHRQYASLYDTILPRAQFATYRQEVSSHIVLDAYADEHNRIIEDDGASLGMIDTNGEKVYFVNVPMTIVLDTAMPTRAKGKNNMYTQPTRELKVTCRAEVCADGNTNIFAYYLDEEGASHQVAIDDEDAIAEHVRLAIPGILSAKCI